MICPLEDFGKLEMIQQVNNAIHSGTGANENNFNRFSIGRSVGVDLNFKAFFLIIAKTHEVNLLTESRIKTDRSMSSTRMTVNHLDSCRIGRICQDGGMGKFGQALKSVLEEYEISQYALSIAMDVERNNVYRWVNEKRDPTGETIVEIVRALKRLNTEAAQQFVKLYLGDEV